MATCFTCELLLIVLFRFIVFRSIAPNMRYFSFFRSE
jgi:hypothetical protein